MLWRTETEQEEGRVELQRTTYIRRFRLMMSLPTEGVKAVRLANLDIGVFTPYPDDPVAICDSFQPVRVEGSNLWNVECNYSTDVNMEENPLALPAEISMDSDDRTRAALRDYKGKPFMNTAGDIIEAEVEDSDMVISVEKNIPTTWPAWIKQYRNAVNTDDITIKGLSFAAGTLKLKKLKIGKDETSSGVKVVDFCKLSFELHEREDGWKLITPSRGFYQLVKRQKPRLFLSAGQGTTAAGLAALRKNNSVWYDRVKILVQGENGSKEPPHDPPMLDNSGSFIPFPTLDNLVFLEFDINQTLPFGSLPLK